MSLKNYKNYKINLYKNGIDKFIISSNFQKNLNPKSELEYIGGILFLTEMNRYCKNNNISIHGYYISISLINIYIKIINKNFCYNDIEDFYYNLCLNVDYLNTRIDSNNYLKNKINTNLSKLIIEIRPLFKEIYNNKLPIIQILSKYFYILLITAKFMGTGNVIDPNLIKLGEYWANVFCTYINLEELIKLNVPLKHLQQEIFDNYLNYKSKLNYSILELKINSETIDEIIVYLDLLIYNKIAQFNLIL